MPLTDKLKSELTVDHQEELTKTLLDMINHNILLENEITDEVLINKMMN